MLKTDIIKWGIVFAEGFEKHPNDENYLIDPEGRAWALKVFRCGGSYYPLFLQRVIEGLNEDMYAIGYGIHIIYTNCAWGVLVSDGIHMIDSTEYKVINANNDEAKEKVIKYVYDYSKRVNEDE